MILDQFDQDVLSAAGKAEDIVRDIYGLNLSQNSAKKYIAGIRKHLQYKQRIQSDQPGGMNEVITKADGTKTTKRMMMLSESDSNDPIRIMQLSGFDPLKWELVSCRVVRNDWDVTMKMREYVRDEEHSHSKTWKEKETNHQYKIELSVKPIQAILSSDYLAQVFEGLQLPELATIVYKPGRLMLELPIMDFHLGKLAWCAETGNDYDLKIAEKLYKDTIEDIISKVKQCNLAIDKIVFPVGQDYFHVDNTTSMTTSGTQVDTDTRWQKMYSKGVELLVWAIENLRQTAPIEIMYIPGNHDKTFSYFAVYTLHERYRECKGVSVDLSPTPRKYIHYGVNLIGYSHGKEGKRIEHIMQQEQPEAWGKSVYREWHLGDLHHEEAMEVGGIKIRRISAITATDAWHNEMGYKSIRMAQAFIWDKEKGRQFVIDSNVVS